MKADARLPFGTALLVPLLAGAVGAALVLAAPRVDAETTYQSPYGYDRTWNAMIRLVRVDSGWKITEKDAANGYLFFEYTSPENSKAAAGSIELIRLDGKDAVVSVVVQIARMPRYHEQVVLDALAAKMRREYGDPPAVRPDSLEPANDGGEAGD